MAMETWFKTPFLQPAMSVRREKSRLRTHALIIQPSRALILNDSSLEAGDVQYFPKSDR